MSISPRHSRSLNQIWDVKEESEKSIFRDLDALDLPQGILDGLPALEELNLQLYDLEHFQDGDLEPISPPESLAASFSSEEFEPYLTVEDDVWAFPGEAEDETSRFGLTSWENPHQEAFNEPKVVYFDEAGRRAYDSALALQEGALIGDEAANGDKDLQLSDTILFALMHLGLGVESELFEFHMDKRSFTARTGDDHISRNSSHSFKGLVALFLTYGNQVRALRLYVDKTYNSTKSIPTQIAFAGLVSTTLQALTASIVARIDALSSSHHLRAIFCRPAQVIASLTSIVAATCAATTDEELLQCFYDQVQDKGASASWLSHILRELLARVSKPWLEQIGTCIGLVARNCLIESRNSLDNLFASQDSTSNRRIPNFISNADLETIRQTSESLDLLESHLPNHVLAQYGSVPCIQASELQWHFGEEDIERIQAKAKQYEASVLNAINANNDTLLVVSSSKPTTYSLVDVTPFEVSEDATEAQFNASYLTCKEPVDEIFPEAENDHYLETVLSAILTNSTAADTEENPQSALPLTISPLFSFSPIISIQARLVNRACLQMLFRDHQLRSHLSLQRRYYLFGDGMFASCLSHALFDAELESAERRSGHSWSEALGLKLGSRNTWPPTSSEIQLVLTGILEETYYYQAHDGDILPRDRDLPGGLSFAIRDLFEDELQRCLDPSSIAALDFLRLRYSPPPPLDSIITQSCLDKYDAIFKLLLRMARMLYVVNQLSRHSISRSRSKRPDPLVQRYHLEAYHFVSSISTYFLNIAVGANWEVFEQKLDEVEHDLDQDQSRLESSRPDGLHQLQEYHECMLDRMMYALFLRKRQEHLMKLLDDIFGAVLCFARSCTVGGIRDLRVDNTGMELKEQYQSFRKNVKGFIGVCGGLADNGAHGSMRNKSLDKSGSSSLKHLLLTLEMNGYYSLQQ